MRGGLVYSDYSTKKKKRKTWLSILHSLAHTHAPSHPLALEQTQRDRGIQPGKRTNWLRYYTICHRGAGGLLSPAGALWSLGSQCVDPKKQSFRNLVSREKNQCCLPVLQCGTSVVDYDTDKRQSNTARLKKRYDSNHDHKCGFQSSWMTVWKGQSHFYVLPKFLSGSMGRMYVS